jgi:UDP-N-acetylglucosamine 2-epimerase (non-hydrolysing)
MATIKVPIYAIIGTRAQFIKVAPLLRMMLDQGINYKLIYTAQHKETIGEILDVYQLPAPDKVLYKYEEAKTRKLFMKWLFAMAKITLFESKKILPVRGIVLTHGDTFTTWIAALMGKLAGCKVAHLESGLRSFNLLEPFPEEIVRLVTFILSDVYFCPGDWAVSNLKRFRGKKVNTLLNPIYDAIQFALNNYPKKDFDFQQKPYVVVSIHRYENIFTNRFTDTILPILEDIAKDKVLVFTLHPTTKVSTTESQ